MKIVLLDGYTENPGDLSWDEFDSLGEVTRYERTSLTDEDEIIERMKGADIVFTNKTPISARAIDACPDLKFISVLATGYNIIDVAHAAEKGIPVTNIPSYGTDSVAQFTFGLLLEICHHIGYHSDTVKAGKWTNSEEWCYWDYPLIELAGKTLGIIGLGKIGMRTAQIARAFGMNVVAYSRSRNEEGEKVAEYVTLDELYERSDVISLHCPLFPDTREMINKESIAKMKDGVIIINASRGALTNEQDLADALNSGKVYAAGIDVMTTEPVNADNPLLTAKNCIITPHIAWAPKEARMRIMDMAIENCRAFLDGKPINVVNGVK